MPDSRIVAAVDLGGTNIHAALADSSGRLLVERIVPTASEEGPERVLARIAALVASLEGEARVKAEAMGVGVPGLIDLPLGVVRFCPNLPTQWRDVPAASMLTARAGYPAYLLNDCRIATLGEVTFGRGRGVGTMLFFALGTGVGGGVVVDGRLRLGALGAAGELGHQTIVPDGLPCGCGNRGCLETLASGPAIAAEGVRLMRTGLAPELHRITEGNAEKVTAQTMGQASDAGDRLVTAAIERAGAHLGTGIANLVTALHPELVVIGGGVAALGERLLVAVRREVAARVRMFPVDGVAIECSQLGAAAGIYGAAALALAGGRVDGTR